MFKDFLSEQMEKRPVKDFVDKSGRIFHLTTATVSDGYYHIKVERNNVYVGTMLIPVRSVDYEA